MIEMLQRKKKQIGNHCQVARHHIRIPRFLFRLQTLDPNTIVAQEIDN